MFETLNITAARSRGLRILAARYPASVYRSNQSSDKSGYPGSVYWQSADWLVDNGFAEWTYGARDGALRLTKAGETYCRQVGFLR